MVPFFPTFPNPNPHKKGLWSPPTSHSRKEPKKLMTPYVSFPWEALEKHPPHTLRRAAPRRRPVRWGRRTCYPHPKRRRGACPKRSTAPLGRSFWVQRGGGGGRLTNPVGEEEANAPDFEKHPESHPTCRQLRLPASNTTCLLGQLREMHVQAI